MLPLIAIVVASLAPALQTSPAAAQNVCLPGTYSETGQRPCAPCPAGSAQPRAAQAECIECRPGTYAADFGQISCLPCTEGTRHLRRGGATCSPIPEPCAPGSFSADGRVPCNPCPPEKAQALAGSTACLLCPQGTTAPMAGASTCRVIEEDVAVAPGDAAEIEAPGAAAHADAAKRAEDDAEGVAPAELAATVALATVALCEPGSYSLTGFAPCLPCPTGAACDRDGTSLQSLREARGAGATF